MTIRQSPILGKLFPNKPITFLLARLVTEILLLYYRYLQLHFSWFGCCKNHLRGHARKYALNRKPGRAHEKTDLCTWIDGLSPGRRTIGFRSGDIFYDFSNGSLVGWMRGFIRSIP